LQRVLRNLFKALKAGVLVFTAYLLVISALDIYNDFAYDKAVLKHSPYGYIPLLENPADFGSSVSNIKNGEFVYVEDWTSAVNGRVVFAKVKQKLNTGYVNQDMLVEANINVFPIISILLLGAIIIYTLKKLHNFYHNRNIVFSKN
jgi:hypothetical protein